MKRLVTIIGSVIAVALGILIWLSCTVAGASVIGSTMAPEDSALWRFATQSPTVDTAWATLTFAGTAIVIAIILTGVVIWVMDTMGIGSWKR